MSVFANVYRRIMGGFWWESQRRALNTLPTDWAVNDWMPDELWHPESPAGTTPSEVDSPPAGRVTTPTPLVVTAPDSEPAQVSAVGGPLKSDEQIIEELVADYREFLRDCFRRRL